jgi:hypothetical protein
LDIKLGYVLSPSTPYMVAEEKEVKHYMFYPQQVRLEEEVS